MSIQVGDKIPDVVLVDQDENKVQLHERLAKGAVVLYFYPKDETPGCTAQACAFRDSFETFTDAGVQVIGVSDDSPSSHRQFAAKFRLPFTLLSDEGGALRKQFGVESFLGLVRGRVTFVIDQQGIVRQRFSSNLNMAAHVQEALKTIGAMKAV